MMLVMFGAGVRCGGGAEIIVNGSNGHDRILLLIFIFFFLN